MKHQGFLSRSPGPFSISIYLFGRSYGLGYRPYRRPRYDHIGVSGRTFGRLWAFLLWR